MKRVLTRRDENWKKLQQYVLDEEERLHVFGPGGLPLYGFSREYTWFIRQGYFIRSPVRFDGVRISEEERTRQEERWVEREKSRERRAQQRAKERGEEVPTAAEAATPSAADPVAPVDVLRSSLEPQFVSMAYFLRFKFEPGHYALAARERLNDRDVLRIEYYPAELFNEGRSRPNKRVRERDDQIEEKMNKVSLITMWIDSTEHQIVQYTFDNIDMDFLPGRSLGTSGRDESLDEDAAAVPRCLAAWHDRHALSPHDSAGVDRGKLRGRVPGLPACRGHDED